MISHTFNSLKRHSSKSALIHSLMLALKFLFLKYTFLYYTNCIQVLYQILMIIFVEIGKCICKSCSCLIYSSLASRLYPLHYVLFYYNVFVNFSLKLDSFLHLKYQQVIFATLIIPISCSYPSTLIMKIFCFDHSFSYIYYQFSQFASCFSLYHY